MCDHSPWSSFWNQEDAHDMDESVPDQPNIWSDGSREPIRHLDIEVAGAGVFAHFPAYVFDNNRWETCAGP